MTKRALCFSCDKAEQKYVTGLCQACHDSIEVVECKHGCGATATLPEGICYNCLVWKDRESHEN